MKTEEHGGIHIRFNSDLTPLSLAAPRTPHMIPLHFPLRFSWLSPHSESLGSNVQILGLPATMVTLTIPASVAKRKQACTSCRQRKKKCDAEHPSCSLCRKLNIRCQYGAPSQQDSSLLPATYPESSLSSDPVALPSSFGMGLAGTLPSTQLTGTILDLPWPAPLAYEDPLAYFPTSESTDIQTDDIFSFQAFDSFQPPSQDIVVQLTNLFFEHLYPMFPCFHKKSFLSSVESGKLRDESPTLFYAICCVSARYHPEDAIKKRSKDWYEQAKFSYNLTCQKPEPTLRTIQSVLLLMFHSWTSCDFSSSWLFLGKAWRRAVVLGLNVDADNAKTSRPSVHEERTSIGKEERRRALWLLFMLDRINSWVTGWQAAIPETQFKVDLLKPESVFQAMNPESNTLHHSNTPFMRNLSELICSSSSAKEPLNVLHYLAIAHVLLGRVSELIHSLHSAPDSPEYAEECAKLDSLIIKFRLSLPRQASSVLAAPPADRHQVVWLQITLNAMTLILHYSCEQQGSISSPSSPFSLAVIAARNVAQIVKDASRISVDLLLSPYIGSSLYVSACVLVIQWRQTSDQSVKDEIDLITLVFERMHEDESFLGRKLKSALENDMKKSDEELRDLQKRGFRGLVTDCKVSDLARQEAQYKGLEISID
ncbi:fungal-specific transcription factor domain-containing protein [Bipolaris maydis]|nr:fungal-specific transcription factor domain-containing protein [Bipolaris maydis]KAJ6271167.1 fungal-specific transcription factor domain-containing protein [Bipolaris maydis]